MIQASWAYTWDEAFRAMQESADGLMRSREFAYPPSLEMIGPWRFSVDVNAQVVPVFGWLTALAPTDIPIDTPIGGQIASHSQLFAPLPNAEGRLRLSKAGGGIVIVDVTGVFYRSIEISLGPDDHELPQKINMGIPVRQVLRIGFEEDGDVIFHQLMQAKADADSQRMLRVFRREDAHA